MQRRIQTQRGSVMVVAMVTLVGLFGLGAVTVLTLTSGMSAAANDRFKTIAFYAAESGAAAGVAYLRSNYVAATHWSALVSASNEIPESPEDLPGNGVENVATGALLSEDSHEWYTVTILNNATDPAFATGDDADGRVIVRSVGHGPNGAIAIVEVEVVPNGGGLGADGAAARPCPGYGQRGMSGDNAGRNDCLTAVDSTIVREYRPGS